MKTPRHLQPWYACRLRDASKPGPITDHERTIITEENRILIEQSSKIIANAVKRGWISYPEPVEPKRWNLPPPDTHKPTSIDPTPPSSSIL